MWHETNTYATHTTSVEDFQSFELTGGEQLLELNRDTGSVIGGFLDSTELDLVPLFTASAWPGGTVTADARRTIFGRILEALGAAPQLDGLLINLHGAMVAEDEDDPEGKLLREIRKFLPDIPIAAVLDLHANPSVELAQRCDVLIDYDTYPHIDMRERGREAAGLLLRMIQGTRLRTSIAKVPILAPPLVQATDANPMRGLLDRAFQRADRAGITRLSLAPGYCYSDVARAGISVLAVHEETQTAAARAVLGETVSDIEAHAEDFLAVRESPKQAVERAMRCKDRPVVLADTADNVGGGSPGDGTALLCELLEQGATGAVVIIADTESALAGYDLGDGRRFTGLVGGKADTMHGEPVEISGHVVKTSDGIYRSRGTWMTGREFSMGRTAVVDVAGTLVVLTENRVPPFHREQLTILSINPAAMNIIVAKGALAWRAAFGDVARTVIEVDTPGICPVNPYQLPRKTAPVRI